MVLKDIKFDGGMFDAQRLVDLHNWETGDNKTVEEFIDVCEPDMCNQILIGWLDKGWLFKFAQWLDMHLYLDLMRLAVSSLGWDNVK